MRRVRAWVRWEWSRRISLGLGVRLIIVERCLKGGVLVIGSIAVAILGSRGTLTRLAVGIETQLDLSSGRGVIDTVIRDLATRVAHLSVAAQVVLALGAGLYGLLDLVEAAALLRRRRWAEYLVLLTTGIFVPIEVAEVIRSVSVAKLLTLLLNVVIVIYLIWRKRLFLDRPAAAVSAADTLPRSDL